MTCPKCNSDRLSVVDSRKSSRSTRRRRKCVVCGVRFSTVEISAKEYENMRQILYQLETRSSMEKSKTASILL